MNDERFLESSRTAQAVSWVMFLLAIGLFAVGEWLSNRQIPDGGEPLQEFTRTSEYFLVACLVFVIGVGAISSVHFGRIGIRSIARGEFPPPGTLVVRRTKVTFGSEA